MNRDILINFIPKPTNKDVIIYDTSLKNLIDVNVMEEYKNLLPIYNLSLQKYLRYKDNIENYEKALNDIYLYKTSWSEEDYLYNLQNLKKTYSNLYNPIKKIENNIDMLQKKIKIVDEKIQIQIAKEEKEINDQKNNIDKKINENVDKLIAIKETYSTLKIESEQLKEKIKENEEDFSILQEILEGIQNGECKCKYCGSKLSNVSENSNFYKRTYKNLEKNKKELEELLERQKKNNEQLNIYETKIKEIKQELKNDSNFKSQDFNFYRKKSVEVLKLEGKKDAMLNEIDKLQKEFDSNSQTKSEKFLELKERIKKYELSLDNLRKIKSMKEKIKQESTEYNNIKNDLTVMKFKMDQYKSFLTIFFKIYEQKAAEFCGKDFRFEIFEFDDYTLIEKFKIYYKSIEYANLNPSTKRKVESILEEKFLFYD